jgi:hypothetical protein
MRTQQFQRGKSEYSTRDSRSRQHQDWATSQPACARHRTEAVKKAHATPHGPHQTGASMSRSRFYNILPGPFFSTIAGHLLPVNAALAVSYSGLCFVSGPL